jgi:hypothetical protein
MLDKVQKDQYGKPLKRPFAPNRKNPQEQPPPGVKVVRKERGK